MLDLLTRLPRLLTGRTRALVEDLDERSGALGGLLDRAKSSYRTSSAIEALGLTEDALCHHVRRGPGGGWLVELEDAREPVRRCSTRAIAIDLARQRAREAGGAVVVHGPGGEIEAVEPARG